MRTGANPLKVSLGFPRDARVRQRADFDRVFAQGSRTGTPLLALHFWQDGQPARLGLAVSRKVDTRAVARNRIKRILRDHFRHLRPSLTAGAYVVVVRHGASKVPPASLRDAFDNALRRAGALPRAGADGTMPAASSIPPKTLPDSSA